MKCINPCPKPIKRLIFAIILSQRRKKKLSRVSYNSSTSCPSTFMPYPQRDHRYRRGSGRRMLLLISIEGLKLKGGRRGRTIIDSCNCRPELLLQQPRQRVRSRFPRVWSLPVTQQQIALSVRRVFEHVSFTGLFALLNGGDFLTD